MFITFILSSVLFYSKLLLNALNTVRNSIWINLCHVHVAIYFIIITQWHYHCWENMFIIKGLICLFVARSDIRLQQTHPHKCTQIYKWCSGGDWVALKLLKKSPGKLHSTEISFKEEMHRYQKLVNSPMKLYGRWYMVHFSSLSTFELGLSGGQWSNRRHRSRSLCDEGRLCPYASSFLDQHLAPSPSPLGALCPAPRVYLHQHDAKSLLKQFKALEVQCFTVDTVKHPQHHKNI